MLIKRLKSVSHRTLLLVAVAALTLVIRVPAIDQGDGAFRIQFAGALSEGRLNVERDSTWPMFTADGRDGRQYSIYGMAQPLVLVPLVMITGADDALWNIDRKSTIRKALLVMLYTLLVNLSLAAVTYGIFRQLRFTPRASSLSTLGVLLCTPWLIWGLSMQEESLVGLMLAGALYASLIRLRGGGTGWLALAGLLAALTANVRPNAVFMVAALFVWLMWCERRAWMKAGAMFLAGSVPSLALFFWWNAYRFGSPLMTGWQAGHEPWSFRPHLFFELLVVPDYGLIWFAPLLLLLPWAGSRAHLRLLAWLLVAGFVLHAALLAGYPRYVGHGVGLAWGPRYLMHGAFMAGPLVWLAWLKLRKSRWRYAALAVVVLAASVQWTGSVFQPRLEYAQDAYRIRRDMERMQPFPWLPRRYCNIYWWATGDLPDKSFPGDAVGGDRYPLTPDLLPLLVAAQPPQLDRSLIPLIWTLFSALVLVLAAAITLMVRKRPQLAHNP